MPAPELGDGGRQQRGRRAEEGDDAQVPAAQPGDGLELALGGVEAGEDRLGVGDERGAGVGQSHAARAALDELRAGLALESGDLLRDRRLGVGERLGRGGERAARGDLAQDPQALHIEHKTSLSLRWRNVICADGPSAGS